MKMSNEKQEGESGRERERARESAMSWQLINEIPVMLPNTGCGHAGNPVPLHVAHSTVLALLRQLHQKEIVSQ